jgi:hypothetical protein
MGFWGQESAARDFYAVFTEEGSLHTYLEGGLVQSDGFATREIFPEVPPKVEYELTYMSDKSTDS